MASEILSRSTASSRAAAIEKWVVVADVCRHLCNFNAVLEIVSALMSSSVFRLKKTWEKLSKQVEAFSLVVFLLLFRIILTDMKNYIVVISEL